LVEDVFRRPDDPRLGEIVELWRGDLAALRPGRAVLLGFPQDEGVRRNHGRPGAAKAPNEIRRWLDRLTPWDGEAQVDLTEHPPLDLGNVRITGDLETAQTALGEVIAGILPTGAIPVVLGGGHETAYGHYLGYVAAHRRVGIVNVDAHLDVRPRLAGKGHSGSPFRQALEHPTQPLAGDHYVCLGAQPSSVNRQHWLFAKEQGCIVRWCSEVRQTLDQHFERERDRLAAANCQVYVTIDADAVQAADVPGVSVPNLAGLSGREVIACARRAGLSPQVSSFDLVEINPLYDRDNQSGRWGAHLIWSFLIGLAARGTPRNNVQLTKVN
jgi:formiminoglutamase